MQRARFIDDRGTGAARLQHVGADGVIQFARRLLGLVQQALANLELMRHLGIHGQRAFHLDDVQYRHPGLVPLTRHAPQVERVVIFRVAVDWHDDVREFFHMLSG